MTEIERLILEVEQRGVSGVNNALDQMDRKVKAADGGMGKLKASTIAITAAVAGMAGAVFLVGRQLVSATRSYQGFQAQLTIATKSAENAKVAFQAIQDFASTTPFSVDQSTQAFIKLTNLGLTPSERALRSYGNTASSMNKSLMDFIEAVADASTGEFERLKEFGIKARKEGEKVRFSFQGVQTEVGATASAIENFLIGIGETKFGGAMEAQMKTLNGAISNLGDAWEQLWQNISNLGPGNVLTEMFKSVSDSITELNHQLVSGELEARVKAWGMVWADFSNDVGTSLGAASEFLSLFTINFEAESDLVQADQKEMWAHFPTYARAAFQNIALIMQKTWREAAALFTTTVDVIILQFQRLVDIAGASGKAIKAALTFDFTASDLPKAIADIQAAYNEKTAAAIASGAAEVEAADAAYQHALELIAAETAASNEAYDQQIAKANEARAAFEAALAARSGDKTDRLAQFKVGGTETSSTAKAQADAEKALKLQQNLFEEQFKLLEQSMVAENQVVADSYERRKEIIMANSATTEAEKKALIMAALSESLVTEEEAVRRSYEDRRAFILSATQLTEDQKTELMKRLTTAREQALEAIEKKHMESRLSSASDFFGNIASIGSTFGKKGFEIAKAAAIAQATIKTYESATSAYSALAGIPYIGPALGAAAAAAAIVAGVANVAQIKAQQYNPVSAYALGGMIPSGRFGLVGEAGPEIVRGPAIVTSAASTASQLGGSSSGSVRTVTIQNHGQPLEAESSLNGDELEIRLRPILDDHKKRTKTEIAQEIERGGGTISRSIEKNYDLRRTGRI